MNFERIELYTRQPAILGEFYRDTLGLHVLESDDERLEVQAGTTRLVFRQRPPDRSGIYHIAFNVPENRLNDAIRWLIERVPIVENTGETSIYSFDSWNAHAVYFYDSAGNILEFIARHDLPNASSAPFDGEQILSISEIGLVTDNVPALAREIESATGIGPYRPGSDSFAPIGDENGLFIVVETGREWFAGNGQHATIVPLEVDATTAVGKRFRITAPGYAIEPLR